jgi:hypothetical protein
MRHGLLSNKDMLMNVRVAVFAISVAIVVAFGYWCKEIHNFKDSGGFGGAQDDSEHRRMAFEGAVVGFLLIYAIVHIYKNL